MIWRINLDASYIFVRKKAISGIFSQIGWALRDLPNPKVGFANLGIGCGIWYPFPKGFLPSSRLVEMTNGGLASAKEADALEVPLRGKGSRALGYAGSSTAFCVIASVKEADAFTCWKRGTLGLRRQKRPTRWSSYSAKPSTEHPRGLRGTRRIGRTRWTCWTRKTWGTPGTLGTYGTCGTKRTQGTLRRGKHPSRWRFLCVARSATRSAPPGMEHPQPEMLSCLPRKPA